MNLDKIYRDKFESSSDIKSLGWGSKFSQEKRFEILLQIPGYKRGDSVLDVGCGYGDLSKYVDNYTGIDLRGIAIDKAKKKYKDANFLNCDIFSITDSYDWVFASGIFCFKNKWTKNTRLHIDKMYELSKKGTAFNFLSDHTKGNRDKEMKYAKIQEVVSMIYSTSRSFTVRHDYLDNDFTIYMSK